MSVIQSKYRIFSLSQGKIVAEASSLREIKVAFQESLKNSDDVCVLDHNLETYARFLGGKVMPGQHYRKFTQRGVAVKPKEIRPAAAPAPEFNPMITYLDYDRAQMKWVEENNVQVGDMVIVRDQAGDHEKGWQNSWACDMDKAVGNQYEVVEIRGSTGIRLKDGLCNWERGFEYPFYVLEKVIGVKDVCRDVIARIDAQKYFPRKAKLFSEGTISLLTENKPLDKSVQAVLIEDDPSCQACAKGGCLLSFIRLKNNVTVEQIQKLNVGGWAVNDKWPQEIVDMFGKILLDEMEVAFELDENFPWTDKSITTKRRWELIKKYEGYYSSTDRMRAIMQHIIDGTF
jgi:hypothetical protein